MFRLTLLVVAATLVSCQEFDPSLDPNLGWESSSPSLPLPEESSSLPLDQSSSLLAQGRSDQISMQLPAAQVTQQFTQQRFPQAPLMQTQQRFVQQTQHVQAPLTQEITQQTFIPQAPLTQTRFVQQEIAAPVVQEQQRLVQEEVFVPQKPVFIPSKTRFVPKPIMSKTSLPSKTRLVHPVKGGPIITQQRKSIVRRDTNWAVKGGTRHWTPQVQEQLPLQVQETIEQKEFIPEAPIKGQRAIVQQFQEPIEEQTIVQQEQIIEAPRKTIAAPKVFHPVKSAPIVQQVQVQEKEFIPEVKGQQRELVQEEQVQVQEQVKELAPEPFVQQQVQETIQEKEFLPQQQEEILQQEEIIPQRTEVVEQFPVKGGQQRVFQQQQVLGEESKGMPSALPLDSPLDTPLASASELLPTELRTDILHPCQQGPNSPSAQRLGLPHGADAVVPNIDSYSFSCEGRAYGYYADQANGCQIYHVCHKSLENSAWKMLRSSYFCPAGTLFDQRLHVCVDANLAYDCSLAHTLYPHTESRFSAPIQTTQYLPSASHLRAVSTMDSFHNNKGGFSRSVALPVAMASSLQATKGGFEPAPTMTRTVVQSAPEFGTKSINTQQRFESFKGEPLPVKGFTAPKVFHPLKSSPSMTRTSFESPKEIPSASNIPTFQGQFLGSQLTSPSRKLQQRI